MPIADLFISYSRRDQQFVHELVDRLSARGKVCWVDWEDIPPTAEWIQEIYEGIEGSDAFAFVITPDSARSAPCWDEVAHAEKFNKRIVPILRRAVDGAELPEAIASREWMSIPESADLDEAVDRLVDVVERDLDHVRRHTRWIEKAREWDKNGRESSFLLRGAELRDAEEWLVRAAAHEPAPTPMHYEYVHAGRGAATKRQRLVVAAFAVGIAVALGLAVVALIQRNQAIAARKTAESRLLASEALSQMDDQLDTGVLLALAAYRVKATPEARSSISVAIRRSDRVAAMFGDGRSEATVVRFAPGGSPLVAAGLGNGAVLLWDRVRRHIVARLQQSGGAIKSLSFSSDGERLAVLAAPQEAAAADRGTVGLWQLDGDRGQRRIPAPRIAAGAIAFAPDDRSLVLGTADGLAVWRPNSRVRPLLRQRLGAVTMLAVDKNGTIAAGGADGVFLVPRMHTAALRPLQVGVGAVIQDLAFDPAGGRLVVVAGRRVFVWHSGRSETLPTQSATAASFGPHDALVTGALNGEVTIWHLSGNQHTHTRPFRIGGAQVSDVAVEASGRLIASAGADGRITLWRWTREDGRLQRSFRPPHSLGSLDDLAVMNAQVAVAGAEGASGEGEVALPNLESGSWTSRLDRPPSGSMKVAVSQGGRVIAAGGLDSQTVVAWIRGKRVPTPLRRGSDEPVDIAVAPDGNTIAEATEKGTLNLWSIDGSSRPPVRVTRSPLTAVAFAPSGRELAVGANDGSVSLVQLGSPKPKPKRFGNVNGKTVGRKAVKSASAVAFAPDGRSVAAAESANAAAGTVIPNFVVTVWRVPSGRQQTFTAGTSSLTSVAYDPRGTAIAAGDEAGRVYVWDARSRQRVGPPLTFRRPIVAVAFDPSGTELVVGLQSGEIVVVNRALWDESAAIRSLCARMGRPLSADERAAYLPSSARSDVCG